MKQTFSFRLKSKTFRPNHGFDVIHRSKRKSQLVFVKKRALPAHFLVGTKPASLPGLSIPASRQQG